MLNLHIATTNQESRANTLDALVLRREQLLADYRDTASRNAKALVESEHIAAVEEIISALYETLDDLGVSLPKELRVEDLLTYTNRGWKETTVDQQNRSQDVLGLAYCSLGLAAVPHPAERPIFRNSLAVWVVAVAHEFVHLVTRLKYHPQDGELSLGYEVRPLDTDERFFKEKRHKKLYRVLNEIATDLAAHAVAKRALEKLVVPPDKVPGLLQEAKAKIGYLDSQTETTLTLFFERIEGVSNLSVEEVRRHLMRGLFVNNSLASLPINAALGKGAWFLISYLTSPAIFRSGLREIIEHNRTNPELLERTILQDNENLVRRFRQIQGRYIEEDFAYLSAQELTEFARSDWNNALAKLSEDQRVILYDYYDHYYGGEEQAFQRGLVDRYFETPWYCVRRTCAEVCAEVVQSDLAKHAGELNCKTIQAINSKLEKLYRTSNRCDAVYHRVVQSLLQLPVDACYKLENLALLISFLERAEAHLRRKDVLSAFDTKRILTDLQFGFSLGGRYLPGRVRVYSGEPVKRLLKLLRSDDTENDSELSQEEYHCEELYVPALSFLKNPHIYYPGISHSATDRLSPPAS